MTQAARLAGVWLLLQAFLSAQRPALRQRVDG